MYSEFILPYITSFASDPTLPACPFMHPWHLRPALPGPSY